MSSSSYTAPPGHGPAPNMPPSVVAAAKLAPKVTATHVYFFGFEGPEPENCFQQWHPTSFHDGSNPPRLFRTTEHYMMYHKARLMNDTSTAEKILAAETPAEAKTLGREVRGFKQDVWDREADGVVEEGNWLKFSQDDACRRALLGTGERILVEASPNDRVWGVGFDVNHAEGREAEWGENRLGLALMRVRERLVKAGKDDGGEEFLTLN